MRTLFQKISSLFALIVACFRWWRGTRMVKEVKNEQLPPIRYEGDARDIYLA